MKDGTKPKSKFWAGIERWVKRLALILGLPALLTPTGILLKNQIQEGILDYRDDTEYLIKRYAITIGIFMDLMDRVDAHKDLYCVLEDGVKRTVLIFETAENEQYCFIIDNKWGALPYKVYYATSRGHWYFYTFEESPYTKIYEK